MEIKDKLMILKRDKYTCHYCNCNNPLAMTIDHKLPVSRGGTDEPENTVACCYICNQLKQNMTVPEFKKYSKALATLKKLGLSYIQFDQKLMKLIHKRKL